jgi:L,D-peptidoglycan transpeptidase YkuD (ErfK/YbiS/YcfS/YnhG family)
VSRLTHPLARVALSIGAAMAVTVCGLATPAPAHATKHHSLATRLVGVHDATQLISVISSGYGDTTATVRAFEKRSGKWHEVYGPWSAWIGYAGFAPPGHKREGDGRTPSGSYPFSFFFGAGRNPGVRYPWRHAASYDVWDDDSASPRYNEWVDTRHHSAGRDPERMHVLPSYLDGAVIAYNPKRTAGRGSAIFLHVTHHSATNGCVSLPRAKLIKLLRWLRPEDHARIIMGTAATVTR